MNVQGLRSAPLCARAQRLTARRSRRMLFNWVLWRYTILYINERSWESGGVARTLYPVMSGPACFMSGLLVLCAAWLEHGGTLAPGPR